MSAGVPGPLRRLLRQPLRAGAIVLLGVTALSAAGIHSAAATALQRTMDENWRGTYDILVTPTDADAAIDGLLPPNTLASSRAGLTVGQWEEVAAVAGVDVAAPIGEILTPALEFGSGRLVIPVGAVPEASEQPQGFRLSVTYTTDDGLGERLVEQREMSIVVDATPVDPPDPEILEQCLAGESSTGGSNGRTYLVDPERYPALRMAQCTQFGQPGDLRVAIPGAGQGHWYGMDNRDGESYAIAELQSAPQSVTRVTLVDPDAERQLLGEGGAFLDPLVATAASPETDVAAMQAWALADDTAHGQVLTEQLVRMSTPAADYYPPAAMAELRQLYLDNDDDFDEMVREGFAGLLFVPILVSAQDIAPLSLKVDVAAVGSVAHDGDWFTGFDLAAFDQPGTSLGSVVGDVSGLVNPFDPSAAALVWPGADLRVAEELAPMGIPQLSSVGSVTSGDYDVGSGGITLSPDGYAVPVRTGFAPGNALRLGNDGEEVGAEAGYADPDTIWEVSEHNQGAFLTPVGSFDAADLNLDETAIDHVPLGAYEPVSSTITGGDHAGTTMRPGLSGLGLVSARTAAIASIHSAGIWGGTTPISAIRVRVAGIEGYSTESQQRVVAVAQAIEDLGLRATIVAGSSPTEVDVLVDGYAFGTMDPDAAQAIGPLGAVTQRWSELGAAARVSLSVGGATLAILGIALAAAVLLLASVQIAAVPARREQAAVMRETGFPRPRIARWFAAEELPGLIAVVLVAVAAFAISGGTAIAGIVAAIVVGVVLFAAIGGVVAGSRSRVTRMPRDARSRRLGARSVAGFGARQSIVHPLTTVVHILAIVLVGLAGAALVAAVQSSAAGAGASSLAVFTVAQQVGPQLTLGATGIVGGILLAGLVRRIDLARRAEQWGVLRAAGWTSAHLKTAQRTEGAAIVVPALIITAGLAWLGAWLLDEPSPWPAAGIAVAVGVVTAVLTFARGQKAVARDRKGTSA